MSTEQAFNPGVQSAMTTVLMVGLALAVGTLASYVALDLARRVRVLRTGAGALWLLGAASAMALGIWSSQVIGTAAEPLAFPIGYEKACKQAGQWRDEGLQMRVAINLSAHQLRHPDLCDRIDTALRRYQIRPQLLTCEITESVAMEVASNAIRMVEKLSALGVNISIDDFGTGYSSLSYLRKLRAGELKIDKSFALDLETSADARAVVDGIVKLAQALGLKVVAEGVETEAQHRILRSFGCHELQGYLFARPMSARALSGWAIEDVGPRSLEFRDSLYRPTAAGALP